MANQTTHRVKGRISELNEKSREIFQSLETEIQREKTMGETRTEAPRTAGQHQTI